MRNPLRSLALCGGILALLTFATQVGETHAPIRSKYTYNDDVFPILRNRCASCHVPGGVAPMSLMTYKDAVPWAESLRIELISGHMPPWYAEQGFGDFKNAHALSGRELDVLLVWASGGTPRGDAGKPLPAVALSNKWALGEPDLAIPMPADFTLPADTLEETQEFVLATGTTTDRWVTAVDLLPGTPAIVRWATVSITSPPGSAALSREADPDQADPTLAVWLPGAEPVPTAAGTAFHLPAAARLTLRVHYKKTWKYEGTPMADRSTIGLYFADRPSLRPIRTLTMSSDAIPAAADETITFSRLLREDVQALALRPAINQPNVELQVEAVRPDGTRIPMLRLNNRADWVRRYWFDQPITLSKGTRLEASATFVETPGGAPHGATADGTAPAARASKTPLRLAVDIVSPAAKGTTSEGR